jgi:hypothetical protein
MLPAVSCKSGSGKSPTRLALLAGLGVLSVLAGCGRSDMAAVSGKVTLDGQPLENAFLAAGEGARSLQRPNRVDA